MHPLTSPHLTYGFCRLERERDAPERETHCHLLSFEQNSDTKIEKFSPFFFLNLYNLFTESHPLALWCCWFVKLHQKGTEISGTFGNFEAKKQIPNLWIPNLYHFELNLHVILGLLLKRSVDLFFYYYV